VLFTGADPAGFNLTNPIATNPAYFMNPNAGRFLYGMMSAVDLFAFWTIFLLALGISRNSRIKTRTAFLWIVILYFVYKAGAAALGAVFA
jgi:hypothetical protein